jgi:hypothetical protein
LWTSNLKFEILHRKFTKPWILNSCNLNFCKFSTVWLIVLQTLQQNKNNNLINVKLAHVWALLSFSRSLRTCLRGWAARCRFFFFDGKWRKWWLSERADTRACSVFVFSWSTTGVLLFLNVLKKFPLGWMALQTLPLVKVPPFYFWGFGVLSLHYFWVHCIEDMDCVYCWSICGCVTCTSNIASSWTSIWAWKL